MVDLCWTKPSTFHCLDDERDFQFSNLGIRIFRAARNFNCVISAFPVEVSSSPPGIHSFLEGTATATGSQLTRTLPPFVSAPATVSLLPSAFGSLTSGAALSAIFSDGTKLKGAEFLPIFGIVFTVVSPCANFQEYRYHFFTKNSTGLKQEARDVREGRG